MVGRSHVGVPLHKSLILGLQVRWSLSGLDSLNHEIIEEYMNVISALTNEIRIKNYLVANMN